MTETHPPHPYRAIATGALEIDDGRDQRQRMRLHMSGPLGGEFALPVRMTRQIPGAELLVSAYSGQRLVIEGSLEWSSTANHRSPAPALLVDMVRSAADEEEGCDIWLAGDVIAPARIARHPLRSGVSMAHLTIRVQISRQRAGSRAMLTETMRIPVVIPLNHHDAPALLRPGNRVAIEGMLERVFVPQQSDDIAQALAEFDRAANERIARITNPAEARRMERIHAQRRRELSHTAESRIIAGYVQLLEGTPATIREARTIRRHALRQRRDAGAPLAQPEQPVAK